MDDNKIQETLQILLQRSYKKFTKTTSLYFVSSLNLNLDFEPYF